MRRLLVAACVLVGCSSEVGRAPAPQDDEQIAIDNVRQIVDAARAHYEGTGDVAICNPAAPVPAQKDDLIGGPYAYAPDDFDTGDAETGWRCLGWAPKQTTTRFQYFYNTTDGVLVGYSYGGYLPPYIGFEGAALGDIRDDGFACTIISIVADTHNGNYDEAPLYVMHLPVCDQ
jgi:hypothetical protein